MATLLSEGAWEGSTYVVTAIFTDEDGDPVVPNSVSWTLTDENGDVVNSRSDVSETPASSVEIVLKGADLTAGGRENAKLYMAISAVYNSIALGSDLPLLRQAAIPVEGALP